MKRIGDKQQIKPGKHSFHGKSKKQCGFVAMPVAGILLGLGMVGTVAIVEKENKRVNYDVGVADTVEQQPPKVANSKPSESNTSNDYFIETYD